MRRESVLLLVAALGGWAAPSAAAPDARAAVKKLFSNMEQAFRKADQPAFQKLWHQAGYRENLVGGSGIPGQSVFRQGTRKSWYLKPDLGGLRVVDAKRRVYVVHCDVWSWKDERAVDGIHALLVTEKGRLLMLGGGEREAEVQGLAERYLKGQPLAPAKRE